MKKMKTIMAKTKQLDARAFDELGSVTHYYAEVAPDDLKPLLEEFSIHNVRTGQLTDGYGGLIDRNPVQTISVQRNSKVVFQPKAYATPREIWFFLRGVFTGRQS